MARMSVGQLLQEARGVFNLYRADEDQDARKVPLRRSGEVVIFLSGLAGNPLVYQSFASRVTQQSGMPVIFPKIGTRFGNFNLLPLDESLDLLRKEMVRLHQSGQVVAAIIGHSLGGIQGAVALSEWPTVQYLFAVGSPIWGTPWPPLARFASLQLGFDVRKPPPHFRRMREGLVAVGNRIVTFSSPGDLIAPPRRCRIHGATNIILNRQTSERLGRPHSRTVHTDCITHPTVVHLIARYLAGDQFERACAL